jgi:hypothetical protein
VLEFLKSMDPLNKRILELELGQPDEEEEEEDEPTEAVEVQLSSNLANKQ